MLKPSFFSGRKVALLTQHGKERVIAPVLEPGLGCIVEHVAGFDTDQLGTFSRDKPRPGSQLDAARLKARKGMDIAGHSIGIASEGSFGLDPHAGLFPWDVEILVWIDDELGIEVVGMAQGPARSGHALTADWQAVVAFAEQQGFPRHQLIVRPDGENDPRIRKDIADWTQLKEAFQRCHAEASTGQVFVELDLRAFANPTRMGVIERAAVDLLQRLQVACPSCGVPGFSISERLQGLPCAGCGLPTRVHRSEVWTCVRCTHRLAQPRQDRTRADPAECSFCNP